MPVIHDGAIRSANCGLSSRRGQAYFGAQVLHPLAMQPCRRAGVPFRVKNSYNPAAEGTLISSAADRGGASAPLVSAITAKNGVQLVDIESTRMLGAYGFLYATRGHNPQPPD